MFVWFSNRFSTWNSLRLRFCKSCIEDIKDDLESYHKCKDCGGIFCRTDEHNGSVPFAAKWFWNTSPKDTKFHAKSLKNESGLFSLFGRPPRAATRGPAAEGVALKIFMTHKRKTNTLSMCSMWPNVGHLWVLRGWQKMIESLVFGFGTPLGSTMGSQRCNLQRPTSYAISDSSHK